MLSDLSDITPYKMYHLNDLTRGIKLLPSKSIYITNLLRQITSMRIYKLTTYSALVQTEIASCIKTYKTVTF